ncbi:MAG: peptidoglycan-associated lipoprotein Pal [Nitrospiraceae bacterium]|nr:MAG: peptidoglycan-associated lipoprotein Pal [Nitrospiraceae bacterium]
MLSRLHLSSFRFCLCLLAVAMLSGCASRKVVTAVEDQSYVPGPGPQAPVSEAKVPPPVPPPVEEKAQVTEQPSTPTPPPQPPVPQARPTPELSDVFFDFDRFVIREEARSGLEVNADLLKSQPSEKILIEGHCDERGTSAYNLVLGERRAQATARYLRDFGVSSSQIQITSYGKERPFCTEHSEACWQSNRRAHFSR